MIGRILITDYRSHMFEIIVQLDLPGGPPGNDPRCIVVKVAGELDIATAPELKDAVVAAIDEGATEVVLDASGIEFIDASGVRAMLGMTEAAKKAGSSLRLRQPSRPLRRIFDLLELDGSIPIEG